MRKVLFAVVLGAVALLGLPGRSSAQDDGRDGGFYPGNRRMFDPRFGRFHRGLDPRFADPRSGQLFADPRFSRLFFDPRFSRLFFDPRFGGF